MAKTIAKSGYSGTQELSVNSLNAENGKLFLTGPVDSESAASLISSMIYLADESTNITLYLDTPGGEVNAGLALVDAIELLGQRVNIDIVCLGKAYSMGSIILACGRKGHRFLFPHASVMIHEPLIAQGAGGSASTIQSVAESLMGTRDKLSRLLSVYTGRSVEEINNDILRDRYFNAKQAIEYGLADNIVTSL